MNLWSYLGVAVTILGAIAQIKASIDGGQPASSPAVNTYIDGKHGSITLTWTPLP